MVGVEGSVVVSMAGAVVVAERYVSVVLLMSSDKNFAGEDGAAKLVLWKSWRTEDL